MQTPRLAEITADNVAAACRLAVAPHQRAYVAPVAHSLAEAYVQPDIAWPRVVYAGEELVGFVMGSFDPGCPIDYFRCGIWRLAIDRLSNSQCMPAPSASRKWIISFGPRSASNRSWALLEARSDWAAVTSIGQRICAATGDRS